MDRIWQIVSVVILIATFLIAPFAIMALISASDPDAKQYVTSSVLRKIAPQHWVLHTAIWASIAFLSCAFWLHSKVIKTELERAAVETERAENDAANFSPPSNTNQAYTPVDKAIAYYEALGYARKNGFEDKDGRQLIIFARTAKSSEGLWHREGAIIYPDGESAKIIVGVLYDSDSWAYNNEFKVHKLRFGKAVKVKTALNRPILEAMAQRSHHLITIGLASMGQGAGEAQENSLQQMNHLVAGARGYNLAYAAWELGWKPAKNIHPHTLGRAKSPPSDPALEPLQRTAIIIGVNAPSVAVPASDAVTAAMRMIDLNHVDLSNYSRSVESPGRVGAVRPGGGYKSRADLHVIESDLPALVLEPTGND